MGDILDVRVDQRKIFDGLYSPCFPMLLSGREKPFQSTWKPCLPEQFLGVEIEVENCGNNSVLEFIDYHWVDVKEDGSLRNKGREFITCPHQAKHTEELLTNIFDNISGKAQFTSRTSVHVHLNVRDITLGQLSSLLYTYLVVEKFLYDWVGEDRDKNIFCVPLQDTFLLKNFSPALASYGKVNWTKYCGLNLAPMYHIGTVEFRHLAGTRNIPRILQWIQILLRMMKYAKTTPHQQVALTISNLNTTSQYHQFLDEVFGNDLVTGDIPHLKEYMETGVSYLKSMSFHNPFQSLLMQKFQEGCKLLKLVRRESRDRIAVMENFTPEIE